MPDWFAQNAPKAPTSQPAADWFAANAPAQTAQEPPQPSLLTRAVRAVTNGISADEKSIADLVVGAGKKLAEEGVRGGAVLRKIPGVNAIDRVIPPVQVNITPSNTTQRVGGGLEQIAEVVAPSRLITKAGVKVAEHVAPKLATVVGERVATMLPRAAVEAAGGAALAGAQGGDPTTAAIISGAIPVVGSMAGSVASKLKTDAAKQVVQALGPTKERFKAMAEKLAPEILRRGIRGSRQQIAQKAADAAEAAGEQIDAALQEFGARRVDTTPVVDALEKAKDAFRVVTDTPAGSRIVEIEPRSLRQLDKLQGVVKSLGDDASADHLVAIRRAWDTVVAQAGGYAHRAPGAIGVPLKDTTEAWAKRQGANAVRQLLSEEVPELAKVNKEYHFWTSLDDVVSQTLKRTESQGPSLTGTIKEAGGQAVGAAMKGGTVGSAFALGKVAKLFNTVVSSPRWKLASAQMKDSLADAIVSGKTDRIVSALARITAVEGSKVPAMVGQ